MSSVNKPRQRDMPESSLEALVVLVVLVILFILFVLAPALGLFRPRAPEGATLAQLNALTLILEIDWAPRRAAYPISQVHGRARRGPITRLLRGPPMKNPVPLPSLAITSVLSGPPIKYPVSPPSEFRTRGNPTADMTYPVSLPSASSILCGSEPSILNPVGSLYPAISLPPREAHQRTVAMLKKRARSIWASFHICRLCGHSTSPLYLTSAKLSVIPDT